MRHAETHKQAGRERVSLMLATALVFGPSLEIRAASIPSRAPASAPATDATPTPAHSVPGDAKAPDVRPSLDKLPLYFVENQGQTDSRVAYHLDGSAMRVSFTAEGVTYALAGSGRGHALKLDFVDANPAARPVGAERTAAVFSYFGGRTSKQAVPSYASVAYHDLWPGIDLVYTGVDGRLKYTFVVEPGADPASIRLAYRGATDIGITPEGRLKLTTPIRNLEEDRPYVYQEINREKVEVASEYALEAEAGPEGRRFGFRLGEYDRSRPLVVDPVVIGYAGFIGGPGEDNGHAIALDGSNNAYVAGQTNSMQPAFPVTAGSFDTTFNFGSSDAFVAKISADGSTLVYCTYLGGSAQDTANSIAVDGSGAAYVGGYTLSANFPMVGAFNSTPGGQDGFVAKINPAGTALVYSSYVGGPNNDAVLGLAIDGSGRAYLTGDAAASFPTTGGPAFGGGTLDAFVARVAADGSSMEYARYLGGSGFDDGSSVAVDGAGNAYVVGYTSSADFPPTTGPALNGGQDAFVTKVNPAAVIVYNRFIGGASAGEIGHGIAVDGAGRAYVTGWTDSSAGFPVTVGPDLTYNGGANDAFVARLSADASTLEYAGYVGGNDDDRAYILALRGTTAYITGYTRSADFPGVDGPDVNFNFGGDDAFVARVKGDGSGLLYSSFLGGGSSDQGRGIAVDASCRAYVVGSANSNEATFPITTGFFDPSYNGGGFDVFVARLDEGCPPLGADATGSFLTVTAPGYFQMRFNRDRGGSMDQFYDLFEDRGAVPVLDLVGGAGATFDSYRAFFYDSVRYESFPATATPNPGWWGWSAGDELTNDAKLDLLEVTSTRVKVRQETFYHHSLDDGPTHRIPALKGFGDYSIYSPGRMALKWKRQAHGSVTWGGGPATTGSSDLDFVVHMEDAGETTGNPLTGWTVFNREQQLFGGSFDATVHAEEFLFLKGAHVSSFPNVTTDFLVSMHTPWPDLKQTDNSGIQSAEDALVAAFTDNTTGLPGVRNWAAGNSETFNFLTYFKPTNLGTTATPWTEAALLSRNLDYRSPDDLNAPIPIAAGSGWFDPEENTSGSDFFNESEAAYLLELNPAANPGLDFRIDGGTTPRYRPFFKIRKWRSLAAPSALSGPGSVSLDGTGLVRNVDYRADVKPVSRGHWTPSLRWHCSMESSTACTPPNLDVGTGGGMDTDGITGPLVRPGKYGNAAVFNEDTDAVNASSSEFSSTLGTIDFWYQPSYNHDDGNRYLLWYTSVFASGTNHCFYIEKGPAAANQLRFVIRSGSSNANCTTGGTTYTAGTSGNYQWRANDWVHITAMWNNTAFTKMRLFVDGVEVGSSSSLSVPPGSGVPIFGGCVGGLSCPTGAGGNASGAIDEPSIYNAGLPQPLANGGLTADTTNEWLAVTSRNWQFTFFAETGGKRAPYLFLGADSKFLGLNVALAASGANVGPDDLKWEYWDGSTGEWEPLLPGGGLVDDTDSFTKPGNVYWTAAQVANWKPFSVHGSPDLYYVRAYLTAGADYGGAYPMEAVIKTDILLFQYCGDDITTDGRRFQFVPPITTAVTLQSLTAVGLDGAVSVRWETASELQNLGFHLYRSESEGGAYARITASLIPGLGSSPTGKSYSYVDVGLVNGRKYFYKLEDVETTGKTERHGPVWAVPVAGSGGGHPPAPQPEPGTAPSGKAYGKPEATSLRVLERTNRHVLLELRTGGFIAYPEADGTVRIEVPGFEESLLTGLPVKRAVVEAIAGRKVRVGSVVASEETSYRGLLPASARRPEIEVRGVGEVKVSGERFRARRGRSERVRLEGTLFQGEVKKAEVLFSPLRVERGRLVLTGRILVRLEFAGVELQEAATGGSRGRTTRKRVARNTGGLVAQLGVNEGGLYRVTFEEVMGSRRRGIAASKLRLSRQGEGVAYHLEPRNGTFGPGSVLYFLSEGSALNPNGEAVYELEEAAGSLQMAVVGAAASGEGLTEALWETSLEESKYYQAGLLEAEDLWQWDLVMSSSPARTYPFTLSEVSSSTTAGELVVELQGANDFEGVSDHHLRFFVNGALAGETTFDGKVPSRVRVPVWSGVLHDGGNELRIENVGDTGAAYSMVFLNRFTVRYPRLLVAEGGRFEGRFLSGGRAEVTGLAASSMVVDSTETPRWIGVVATAGGVAFRAEAGRKYLASASVKTPRVVPIRPSTLKSAENQADYLVIGPEAFLEVAEPLLEQRRSQGLVSRAVSTEEVFQEFGHGENTPGAIREFLEYAYQQWKRPSVRYVVLLGDATYDPKDYLKTGVKNQVPPAMVKTSYLWTASDPFYASVNGKDLVPDLAIGRLSAASVEEARVLVEKVLAWEGSGQSLGGAATLVADNPDLAGDFESNANEIADTLLSSRNPERIFLREQGASTRPAIRAVLDRGLSLLSYVGHGGTVVWASENVFNYQDVTSLALQPQQPLLLTMNCLNGFFHFPPMNSLAEALVKAEGKGAIAAFSPSGLSLNDAAHVYHKALLGEIVSGRHPRLGDAVLAAQAAYADSGAFPELLSIYHLFGDPALKIQ